MTGRACGTARRPRDRIAAMQGDRGKLVDIRVNGGYFIKVPNGGDSRKQYRSG